MRRHDCTANPAAEDRKQRRVGSTGVFVGGVLCTLSAWVMESKPFMVRVRAGAEARHFPSACKLCKSMRKTTRVKQKVMGRPRTGVTPLMGFRADPIIRASIVRWAENQPDTPTLSEAIRRLVELGLKVKGKQV
jgi:hypothetical protein